MKIKLAIAVGVLSLSISSARASGLEANVSSGAGGGEVTAINRGVIHSLAVPSELGSSIVIRAPVLLPNEQNAYMGTLKLIYQHNNADPAFVPGDISSDPRAYVELDRIRPEYLMASNNGYELWMGTNAPATGNFQDQTGTRIGFPVVIQRTNGAPFSLADVRVYVEENGDPEVLNQQFTYKNTTYGQARGLRNGQVVDGGLASTNQVDRLEITPGMAYTVNAMATADAVRQHIAATQPFVITITVELLDANGNVESRKHATLSTIPTIGSPTLAIARVSDGKVRFTVQNGGNLSYQLQRSSSLGSSWANVGQIDASSPLTYEPTGSVGLFRLTR